MRDVKTYLSVAPVLSSLWFGALAGLLIEINCFFPGCVDIPLFFILISLLTSGGMKKIREIIKYL